MTLLPKVAASGTEPETRPLGSVSLSFQTRPYQTTELSERLSTDRRSGSEITNSAESHS